MEEKIKEHLDLGKQYWWIIVLVFILLLSIIVIFSCNQEQISRFERLGELLSKLITPVCVILGLILGYPLLKRKLLDGYISKQFEIIYNANRKVRNQCLQLREKYYPQMNGHDLTRDDLIEALKEMKALNEIAIDASENVYKYSYLVYKALSFYEEKTRNGIKPDVEYRPYREGLYTWLHYHIMQIYRYSRSVGIIPQMDAEERKILNDRLDRYVTDNSYFEIKNLDKSISYQHNSAQLVIFSGLNNSHIDDGDWILEECCYKAAPSPCPFARLMYNECIYIPPILIGEKFLNVFDNRLVLISYKRKISTKILSGIKSNYYICTYANISDMAFVNVISSIDDLAKYSDAYLHGEFNIEGATDFHRYSEMIRFRIPEKVAIQNYERIAMKLKDKLESEI